MPPAGHQVIAEWLAKTLAAGEPSHDAMLARATKMLGRKWRWLAPLTGRYSRRFDGRTRPRHREVVQFLLDDRGFRQACERHGEAIKVVRLPLGSQQMRPVPAASGWPLPRIETVGELAEWLRIEVDELNWFGNLKNLGVRRQDTRLDHYHYRVLAKAGGSVRLIEIPKPRIKQLQQEILKGILEIIPPHSAANGFIKGRSIRSFVAPHVNKPVVLRMDVTDFFPSFRFSRIESVFRTFGYPESVARLLAGICTNSAPQRMWNGSDARKSSSPQELRGQLRESISLYSERHLPQGAPSSPALANLCCFRLDCRLAGLAEAAGVAYSRYADDLAFSGESSFTRKAETFTLRVAAILFEEGLRTQHRKTRWMTQAVRQHLAGLVVNQRINIPRAEFDGLKAVLTNCARLGPASQNREGILHFRTHLEGRVSFVETIHPGKGKKLRLILNSIRW